MADRVAVPIGLPRALSGCVGQILDLADASFLALELLLSEAKRLREGQLLVVIIDWDGDHDVIDNLVVLFDLIQARALIKPQRLRPRPLLDRRGREQVADHG